MKDIFAVLSAAAALVVIADYLQRASAAGEVAGAVGMNPGPAPGRAFWQSGTPDKVTAAKPAGRGQWEQYGVLPPYSFS